jgi:hypothetical protein
MSVWKLTHTPVGGSAVTKLLGGSEQPGDPDEGWGMEVATRTDKSLSTDMVSLKYTPDDYSDAGLPGGTIGEPTTGWNYGDSIIILRDDSPWFQGQLHHENRMASGTRHEIGWQVAGPWQAMEELTYFQTWGTTTQDGSDPPAAVAETRERGDVTLMQSYNSTTGVVTVLKTGEQIHELAEFATTRAGASPLFQVADLTSTTGSNEDRPMDRGLLVDFIQATDETVANLIRQLAKWTPGAVSWFDYESVPPTFHYSVPSASDEIVIDMDVASTRKNVEINLTPNHELVIPYVKIAYKRIDTVDVEGSGSGSYMNVVYDEFPVGSSASLDDHRKALRATVNLDGADASVQVQKCRTRTLPYSSDGSNLDPLLGSPPLDAPGTNAWKDQVRRFCSADDRWPWLKDFIPTGDQDSNIGVVSFKVEPIEFEDEVEPIEGEPLPPALYDLWETPRVLETGATAEWMNVKSQKVKVTATLIFKNGVRKRSKGVRQHFSKPGVAEWNNGAKIVGPAAVGEWTVTATSALTKSYERTTAQTVGEDPPEDIAELLYNQLASLRHSGSVTFDGDEFDEGDLDVNGFHPGMTLSIVGADINNPEWDADDATTPMNAVVQTVSQSFGNRNTTLTLGTPKQLGLNDFVTLQRLWRSNPPIYTTTAQRTTGKQTG